MAKENPQGSTMKYKVLLRPTAIGVLVMDRLQRPHLDMSAELRRLIELGYAAEQSGFILDGTVLRHAGRVWDTQPELCVDTSASVSVSGPHKGGLKKAAVAKDTEPMQSNPSVVGDNLSPGVPVSTQADQDLPPDVGSSLLTNLRSLSG